MFERDVDVSNGVVGRQIGAAREDDEAKKPSFAMEQSSRTIRVGTSGT